MGEPDVGTEPAEGLDVLDGAAAELLAAEVVLVDGLGEVRMEPHSLVAREQGGLLEQVRGHRERRAGGDADPQHRVGGGVVVPVDRVGGRGQDLVEVLHDVVGRQTTLAGAEVHRPPGREEAQPDLPSCLDLGAEQVAAVRGEDVVVVGRRRTARPRKLHEGPGRSDAYGVLVEAPPHRVERGQPLEERVVDGRAAGQPLVQVVVRVDQAGRRQATRPVDVRRVVEAAGRRPGGDRHDPGIFDHDVPDRVLGAVAVHGDHRAAVEDDRHRSCSAARCTASMIFS